MEDKGAYCAAGHGVAESWTRLSNRTTTDYTRFGFMTSCETVSHEAEILFSKMGVCSE